MLTIMTMTMTMATFALNDDYNVKDDLDVGKETIYIYISGRQGQGHMRQRGGTPKGRQRASNERLKSDNRAARDPLHAPICDFTPGIRTKVVR